MSSLSGGSHRVRVCSSLEVPHAGTLALSTTGVERETREMCAAGGCASVRGLGVRSRRLLASGASAVSPGAYNDSRP